MNQRHFLLQEYIIDYVVLSGIIMINQPTSQVGKMKLFATSRGRKHPPQLAEGISLTSWIIIMMHSLHASHSGGHPSFRNQIPIPFPGAPVYVISVYLCHRDMHVKMNLASSKYFLMSCALDEELFGRS
ncbi:hypothetical protein TESG_07955 [Trichophyton tonsurans CBS 112818]|uniref:Uncharacterized protein n=2 Tax=Trichophyton TaxID=5550 RepID=F2PJP3_TRIEC|nr:hypothetical protein TESG_07955 [Trichophyton tonsurans CBS 112818]EGE02111.1 hypothetical protein TEQG_01150 [Trichophyton equinum CBS 127.97]